MRQQNDARMVRYVSLLLGCLAATDLAVSSSARGADACPLPARYVTASSPIIGTVHTGTREAEILQLTPAAPTGRRSQVTISINYDCDPITASVHHRKNGGMVLTTNRFRCHSPLPSNSIKLVVTLKPQDCTLLQGKVILGRKVRFVGRYVGKASVCGDGVTDEAAGETCDDGNRANGDGCSANCLKEKCGDGILTPGTEECDDGNTVSCDGCSSTCKIEKCGNAIVDCGEDCDGGPNCSATCKFPKCGDGVVNPPGEECDDGNTVSCDGCSSTCKIEKCGNGIKECSEQCDGVPNCTARCMLIGCGNGIVDPGELCDDGNQVNGDGCDNNCTPTGCGNGIITTGEQCDDNNKINGDGCDNNCTPTECGNGIITTGEQCDDGPKNSNTGACTLTCTKARCGDGFTQTSNGEECDNGAQNDDNAACTASCKKATCGDGLRFQGVEQCDDGNGLNDGTDGCACCYAQPEPGHPSVGLTPCRTAGCHDGTNQSLKPLIEPNFGPPGYPSGTPPDQCLPAH